MQRKTKRHMENDIFISLIDAPQYGYLDTDTGKYVRGSSVPRKTTVAAVADYIRTQAEQETQTLRAIPRGETIPVTRKIRMHDGSFVDFTKDIERAKHYKATHFKRAYFGGVLQGGFKASNIVQHSNVVALDFDGIGTGAELEQARQTLMHDTQVQPLLLFVSPSGNGLKMVCRLPFTDATTWRNQLAAVWFYIEKTHGLVADAACKDLNRGCYLPNDKNVYFNPQAQTTLEFDKWAPPAKPKPQVRVVEFNGTMGTDAERAAWYAEQLELQHVDVTGTQTEWARIGYAIAELGETGRGIFHTVSRAAYIDYDFDECERMFNYCQATRTGNVGIATFFKAAIDAIGTTFEQEHKTEYNSEKQMIDTNTQPQGESAPAGTETGKADVVNERKQFNIAETMLHNPTLDEIQHAFGYVHPAIPTQYVFGIGNEQERLTLPNQALTVIAAQTSGGKTRMLQNIALQVARYNTRETQGETLFFSLEEPATDVLIEMANIAHNQVLTVNGKPGKNADIIRNAQRALYKQRVAKTDAERTQAFEEFAPLNGVDAGRVGAEFNTACQVMGEFWATYLQPRNIEHHDATQPLLRVYCNEEFCKVETMCQAVREYQNQGGKIKAIFVDYLGMFRTTNPNEMRLPKTERIERTLDALEWLAKDVNAPVVISAQLKRERDATPWTLRNSSVADSADVERSCNTMVLLWNSREPFEDATQQANLAKAGFVTGNGGKLFARMTKRRGGIRNGAAILNFAENTGAIAMGTGVDIWGNTTAPAATPGAAPQEPGNQETENDGESPLPF